MPKEIDGVLKYRKSELLAEYIKYLSKQELTNAIYGSKTFVDNDLNYFIETKFFTIEELESYVKERNKKIKEFQDKIDALIGIPGQEEAIANLKQQLQEYIDSEEFEFIVNKEINKLFSIDPEKVPEGAKFPPESEISKLASSSYTNCIIGPEAEFVGLDINSSTFTNCTLRGSKLFTKVDLYKVKFLNCKISEVNFSLVGESREKPPERPDIYEHDYKPDPRPYDNWTEILYEDVDKADIGYDQHLAFNNFTESTLSNCLFVNKELCGMIFTGAMLNSCKFEKVYCMACDFNHTNFDSCTLSETTILCFSKNGPVIFSNSTITDSVLNNLRIIDSDFSTQIFKSTRISDCEVIDCSFENVNLKNSGIQNSRIVNTPFEGAILDSVPFIDSSIENCSFIESKFEYLESPDFKNVILENIRFSDSVEFGVANFCNSKLINIKFKSVAFIFANFDSIELKNVNLENCFLNGLSATESLLTKVDFKNCEIRGADISDSSLDTVNFADCDLCGTDLSRTTRTKTEFINSDLHGVLF